MSQTKAELLSDSFGTTSTGTIPIGGIIMWSGSIASIPTGWKLCNGSNGTPDLRNKFVLGATNDGSDSTYPGISVSQSGGSANAVVVSHSHTATTTISPNPHGHTVNAFTTGSTDEGSGDDGGAASTDNTSPTTLTASTSIAPEGVIGTNANLPPYYALAYIMRVS